MGKGKAGPAKAVQSGRVRELLPPWDDSEHSGTGAAPKGASCPEEGERGGWDSRVPSAGLERLLSRCLVQSEKKSAQHSYHRVQKKQTKQKEIKRKEAQGWAPPTHTGHSTTDLFTASPRPTAATQEQANRKALTSKPAWGVRSLRQEAAGQTET